MNRSIICSDGSAVVANNSFKGFGGLGVYMKHKGREKFLSKGFKNTKTGRMEIMALLYGLLSIPLSDCNGSQRSFFDIYSDSEYVIKSFTENRLNRWIAAGWKNTSGDVANRDLWERVLSALKDRPNLTIEFHHIKGHLIDEAKAKNPQLLQEYLKREEVVGNYIADKLADYKRHKTHEIDQIL